MVCMWSEEAALLAPQPQLVHIAHAILRDFLLLIFICIVLYGLSWWWLCNDTCSICRTSGDSRVVHVGTLVPRGTTWDTNRPIIHVDCIGVLCLGFGSQISKARCRSRRTRYYRQGYPRTPKIEMFFVYCRVYSTSIFSSLTSVLYIVCRM